MNGDQNGLRVLINTSSGESNGKDMWKLRRNWVYREIEKEKKSQIAMGSRNAKACFLKAAKLACFSVQLDPADEHLIFGGLVKDLMKEDSSIPYMTFPDQVSLKVAPRRGPRWCKMF